MVSLPTSALPGSLSLTLGLNSDSIAVFAVLGLITLVAFVAIFFPAVRRNNATFATCIVVLTIAVSVVGVGLATAIAYKLMGF